MRRAGCDPHDGIGNVVSSQRLLDDFFRAGFTVSEVEQAVRIALIGLIRRLEAFEE